nr:hypothetical protein [Caballeronia hypogeia]
MTNAVLMFAALAVASALTTPVFAQGPASATSAASSVKDLKAQKRAERKARRAKKNAELKELEERGYQPGGSRIDAPQPVPQMPASGQTSAK